MPKYRLVLILIIISVLIVIVSPFLGLSTLDPAMFFDSSQIAEVEIFWRLRFPRALAAFFAGAGLSVSGLVFQAMFRNPLATPFTLGISSGASLGASVYFWLGAASLSFLGVFGSFGAALLGAWFSMALVYFTTRSKGGFSSSIMLLAGVIINFFFSSLVLFIQFLSDSTNSLRIMHWLMGSLADISPVRLVYVALVIIMGSLAIWLWAAEIDLLTAGEDLATSRGVNVGRTKLFLFTISSLIVGSVVSLAGPIGFVGMMVPHACRMLLGWSHRLLIPASFFAGGAFLTVCDMISRMVLAPAEVPVGIITALLGGPFFLWTLFRWQNDGDLFS